MSNQSSTPKIKKPFYRRGWFILLVIIAVICIVISARSALQKAASQKVTYTWPDSALAATIPQPDSGYGKIHMENEEYLHLEVYKVSKPEFESYLEECKNRGFTVDYKMYDTSYNADNETGYSLSLSYKEKDKTLDISLDAPPKETPSEEDYADELPEADDTSSQPPENTSSPEPEDQTPDATTPAESEAGETDGIRPEFQEAMDSYEAFYEEYCEFMKKYKENPSDLKLISGYTDMMSKAVDVDEKFKAWNESEMNNEELKYYLEVTNRVAQKLLEVSE